MPKFGNKYSKDHIGVLMPIQLSALVNPNAWACKQKSEVAFCLNVQGQILGLLVATSKDGVTRKNSDGISKKQTSRICI